MVADKKVTQAGIVLCHDIHLATCANPKLTDARFSDPLISKLRQSAGETMRVDLLLGETNPVVHQKLEELGATLENRILPNGLVLEYTGELEGRSVIIEAAKLGSYCVVPNNHLLGKTVLRRRLLRTLCEELGSLVRVSGDGTLEVI